MAGFECEKQHFPLQSIRDVIDLFRRQLNKKEHVNLSLLSVILGTIENALTVNRSHATGRDAEQTLQPIFPIVEWETISDLYTKFETIVKSSVDLSKYPDKFATRELVKRVSDVIWGGLTRAFYKDKAHLQSLYSFLTGNKLDCFGVAYAVVAAFQVLGYEDVHLALSEDHAWVIFGEDQSLSAEVTWHGKGNEDKRGQPITETVYNKRWLYLNGYPVICTKQMEVAAIVSAINPSITVTIDSVEMASLQQELLWMLYDMGHLEKYPMALGNLGDLEEICETPGRPPPIQLFKEGVESAKTHYNNMHIYPYTYLGGHMFRTAQYKLAIESWAQASAVIKSYNYNREDEEIYKEFIEIANDCIPQLMRYVSSDNASRLRRTSLLYDTEAYGNFLRFYDGICEWEQDSTTPVLHTVWAKQFLFSLGKFDSRVRKCMFIHAEGEPDESSSSSSDGSSDEEVNDENRDLNGNGIVKEEKTPVKGRKRGRRPSGKTRNGDHNGEAESEVGNKHKKQKLGPESTTQVNGNTQEEQIKSAIEEIVSKVGDSDSQRETPPNPNIAALAQACSESILNPDYLLTGGEPFTSTVTRTTPVISSSNVNVDVNEFLSSKSDGTQFVGMTVDSMLKAESPADMMIFRKQPDSAPTSEGLISETPEPQPDMPELVDPNNTEVDSITSKKEVDDDKLDDSFTIFTPETVELSLCSQKMKGMRKLLTSLKLNPSAISLQLTAQSQTFFKNTKRGEMDYSHTRKRSRREVF